jgi:hypothetical protein
MLQTLFVCARQVRVPEKRARNRKRRLLSHAMLLNLEELTS